MIWLCSLMGLFQDRSQTRRGSHFRITNLSTSALAAKCSLCMSSDLLNARLATVVMKKLEEFCLMRVERLIMECEVSPRCILHASRTLPTFCMLRALLQLKSLHNGQTKVRAFCNSVLFSVFSFSDLLPHTTTQPPQATSYTLHSECSHYKVKIVISPSVGDEALFVSSALYPGLASNGFRQDP